MTFIFTEVVILQLYSLYEEIICREEEDEEVGGRGLVKKKSLLEYTCRDLLWL